ncbi:prephenate dehydratase [Bifidobacterium cuniculi]|uniref:prephenate dehydratase n=1 Tax=Bifidobacterium cuniculi TaxID=1688 RepID=A0A087B3K3_9BIFI|nr:prephenate dehydratase domain-containing protein [Bifidobacterium cuniculi]KFI65603.1 putative chorismate mutase [Bifidobacterium cuniculi]
MDELLDAGPRTLAFLGPEGTFTHQAACQVVQAIGEAGGPHMELRPCRDATAIMRAVEEDGSWGVLAWENNVEGYVVPNLDMMIDAADAAAFLRVGVEVSFDAYVSADAYARYGGSERTAANDARVLAACTTITAHPHGLAQCRGFAQRHGLHAVAADSNGAACRDVQGPQVALGPSICGPLYGLVRLASHVEDYPGARTEFLAIASRADVRAWCARFRQAGVPEYESILTVIPLVTGPGVLANLLDVMRDAGLNMTSFISRPIKGHDGTYSFIATLDAAPWEPRFHDALDEIAGHGDWLRTLATYPRRERPHPPVDEWMLPQGGVRCKEDDEETIRKELLW